MKNYVYVMFNKLSGRYESVLSFPSDGMALHRLEKGIDKDEYDICRVGSIDIATGIIESEPPVRLIWSTEETLPKTEAK